MTFSKNFILLIFELIEFIDSDHQYVFLISFSTKSKLVEITLNQFKSSTSTNTKSRTRTTSEISKHSRFWSLNWTIDKSLFKRAVKRFENCFSKLISNRKISENLSTDNIKQSRHISMSKQNNFSFNQIENANEFFSVQLIDLIKLISQTLNNRQFNINVNVNLEFHSSSLNDVFDHRQIKNWSAEKIEFFDSVAKETDSIVNVEKHVLYKDVYAFTDKLKNMTIIKEESKFKLIIFQCLRKSTLIWHSIELFTLKKEMLKNASLINWYNALIRRFKKKTSIVLISMQNIKYIMNDVKQQKNFRLFAQNFFRIVKTANLTSIHNQLIIAWNNLAWQFRQHIFESIEHTTIREFLEQLNSQTSIWYEMIKSFNFIFRRYSKSYYQNNERNMNRFYFNRNSRFSNILNNVYQEYQKHHFRSENRRREKFRRDVIIKVEKKSNEREFDKNANERKFDRNSQNKIYDNFRHYEKNRTSHDRYKIENKSDYKNKDKAKIFIIERKNNLKLSKNSNNDDYNQFENFAYFDFDDEKEFDISTLLITFIKVKCRQCHASFFFNNRLH